MCVLRVRPGSSGRSGSGVVGAAVLGRRRCLMAFDGRGWEERLRLRLRRGVLLCCAAVAVSFLLLRLPPSAACFAFLGTRDGHSTTLSSREIIEKKLGNQVWEFSRAPTDTRLI